MSDEHSSSDDGTRPDQSEASDSTNSETQDPESTDAVAVSDHEGDGQTAEDSASSPSSEDRTGETSDTATTNDEKGDGEQTVEAGSSQDDSGEDIQEEISTLRAEIEDLQESLEDSKTQIEQLESRVEDYERRNSHEHENIKKYATEDLVSEMLRVKDMLEDAIEMEDLEEGTERRLGAVTKQFDKTITSGSIERIEPAAGEPYDDEYHRMMDKIQTDEYEPEQIVEVLEGGYRAHDRVIRPARVRVATGSGE